jgi:tRNA A37 threonylcarbamoyladenosine synthetase subunit TsaC/SUA5/YrdC
MPLHPIAHEIMGDEEILATTSPNKVGQTMGKNIAEIKEQFGNDVAVYLDAGELALSSPSSILDLTSELPILVREGSVSLAEISLVIENVVKEVEELSGDKEQQTSN